MCSFLQRPVHSWDDVLTSSRLIILCLGKAWEVSGGFVDVKKGSRNENRVLSAEKTGEGTGSESPLVVAQWQEQMLPPLTGFSEQEVAPSTSGGQESQRAG